MNHATARAAERNPSPSLAYGYDIPAEMMARAEQASRVDETHNDEFGGPPERSAFFLALSRQQGAEAPDGSNWRTSNRVGVDAYRIAQVDCCLAGLAGIVAVLHANHGASFEGNSEESLAPYLTDKLHFAARALLRSAEDHMEYFRTNMGVHP